MARVSVIKAACKPDPQSILRGLQTLYSGEKGGSRWGGRGAVVNKVHRKEEVFREKLPSGTPGSFLCDSYKLSTQECLQKWGGLYVLCLFAFLPVSSAFCKERAQTRKPRCCLPCNVLKKRLTSITFKVKIDKFKLCFPFMGFLKGRIWKDGSGAKGLAGSSIGPEFSSQHPLSDSKSAVTLVSGDLMPYSGLHGHCIYVVHRHKSQQSTYTRKIIKQLKMNKLAAFQSRCTQIACNCAMCVCDSCFYMQSVSKEIF